MKHQPRIAVIGSANIDLVTYTDQFPRPGETIFGREFSLGFGGKGANQAVAARLCGAEVAMVARVGDDLFGPANIENFASRGIDTSRVLTTPGVSSGVAPIFVESSGQNRIWVVKGANDRLSPADVDAAAAMLEGAAFLVLQLEIPLETVYHALRFARAHGIRSILNPAPGQALDLARVAHADYVIPNETEAEALAGVPVHNLEDARRCAKKLLDGGVRRVIVTLGANGALCAGYHRRGRRVHRQPGVFSCRGHGRDGCDRARQFVRGAFDAGGGNAEIVCHTGTVRRGVAATVQCGLVFRPRFCFQTQLPRWMTSQDPRPRRRKPGQLPDSAYCADSGLENGSLMRMERWTSRSARGKSRIGRTPKSRTNYSAP
jgi:ribokinase